MAKDQCLVSQRSLLKESFEGKSKAMDGTKIGGKLGLGGSFGITASFSSLKAAETVLEKLGLIGPDPEQTPSVRARIASSSSERSWPLSREPRGVDRIGKRDPFPRRTRSSRYRQAAAHVHLGRAEPSGDVKDCETRAGRHDLCPKPSRRLVGNAPPLTSK